MDRDDNEMPELIGQIIDIFEDFLEEKGIIIDNPETDDDRESAAIIYGSDYYSLELQIRDTLTNWNKKGEQKWYY